MPYDAERGSISIALGGDILLSRGMQVYREPEFLRLRELLRSADACFANLETSVLRYGEGIPALRTGTHMVTEPELLEDLKWLGVTMVSCANSHSLNFGEEGLLLQNRYLDEANATPADFFDARTAGDKGHPATREFWQSALAPFQRSQIKRDRNPPYRNGFWPAALSTGPSHVSRRAGRQGDPGPYCPAIEGPGHADRTARRPWRDPFVDHCRPPAR
jgi:Bacterial capsule synthesis protein PGA_cap